jgi:hypothetical protein
MVRTQIQLTEDQVNGLKRLAEIQGVSMAELIRQGVSRLLAQAGALTTRELRARAAQAAGRFRSGRRDVARRHDKYLAEILKP